MKIAIDATRAVIENAGIGRYAFEIITHLLKEDSQNEYLIFSTHFRNSREKDDKFNQLKASNVELKRLRIPGNIKEFLWGTRLGLAKYIVNNCDLLFAPSFFEVDLGLDIAQVVTIHDMATAVFPNQRGLRTSKRLTDRAIRSSHKAGAVICVSESTKKDLIKYSGIDASKVDVIYPGVKKFSKIADTLPANLKSGEYILTVGTLEPRKNIIGLLKAYHFLPDDLKKRYPLVIVGGKGWNDSEIYNEFNKEEFKRHVILTGFVSDDVLARLYKDCSVFAYPSLYEGFGFPIIEAQSFGAPVLTSNISSLPEAGGAGAIYVNPNNPREIASGLEKLLKQDSLRKSLQTKAFPNSKNYSWEKAAVQTLKLFENVW